jgi:hypothetical protein
MEVLQISYVVAVGHRLLLWRMSVFKIRQLTLTESSGRHHSPTRESRPSNNAQKKSKKNSRTSHILIIAITAVMRYKFLSTAENHYTIIGQFHFYFGLPK